MEFLNHSSSRKRGINEAVNGSIKNISTINHMDAEFYTLEQFNVELSKVITSSVKKFCRNPAENSFSVRYRDPIKSEDQPAGMFENPQSVQSSNYRKESRKSLDAQLKDSGLIEANSVRFEEKSTVNFKRWRTKREPKKNERNRGGLNLCKLYALAEGNDRKTALLKCIRSCDKPFGFLIVLMMSEDPQSSLSKTAAFFGLDLDFSSTQISVSPKKW